MVTFIKVVIARVKNGSPDKILTAFEGKFGEKKDEIPPGICRPHILEIVQYWEWEDIHKSQKMVINGVPGDRPWPEFGMHLITISTKVFLSPKDPNFN